MAPLLEIFEDGAPVGLDDAVRAAGATHLFLRTDPLTLVRPIRIDSVDGFRVNESKAQQLKGKHIVVVDFALDYVPVTERNLYGDAALFDRVLRAVQAAELRPEIYVGGMYLACLALASQGDWQGVVCPVSRHANPGEMNRVMLDAVSDLSLDWSKRSWKVLTGGLLSRTSAIIDEAVRAYVAMFGGLSVRLHPPYTEGWFRQEEVVTAEPKWERKADSPPHTYNVVAEPEYAQAFIDYLASLWRLRPTDVRAWWDQRDEDKECHEKYCFHEALKTLTGYHSDGDATWYRVPNLGALVILAAAICPQPSQWLFGVRWCDTVKVTKTPRQSVTVMNAFSSLAEKLLVYKWDATGKTSTISAVQLTASAVIFTLTFDVAAELGPKLALLSGEVATLYEGFRNSLDGQLEVILDGKRVIVRLAG